MTSTRPDAASPSGVAIADEPIAPDVVDLNADLGEDVGDDAAMLDVVTSANVACGGHAGDEQTMAATVRAALTRGVVVGAHPSYHDRESFGRRAMSLPVEELRAQLWAQVGALEAIAAAHGSRVAYVKAHGALYHACADDEAQAWTVVDVAARVSARPLPVMGLPGSALSRIAARAGVPFVTEAFADRASTCDGRLVPRGEPGAVIVEPGLIAERVRGLAVSAHSVCVHGDTPGAVVLARTARFALEGAGVRLAPFATDR